MAAPYNTISLNTTTWDLELTVTGNIALSNPPYALAQDAASALKTFQREAFYDTTIGVPYWQTILGYAPPISLIKAQFNAAALTVPGVASAQCFLSSFNGRELSGQVQITDSSGNVQAANF